MFGYRGIEFLKVESDEVIVWIALKTHHIGWAGSVHAGTIFALADSCAGYGCARSLPDVASGFTTIETKITFLATVRGGNIQVISAPIHRGRSAGLGGMGVFVRA